MKFKILILFAYISSVQLLAGQEIHAQPQSFLLKGKVVNGQKISLLRFGITSYYNNETQTLPIQSDGTFSQNVAIDGIQDIYLYLNNDAITFHIHAGDTIEINWDEQNFRNTFKVTSPNKSRAKDLQLNLKLHNAFREVDLSLSQKLYAERDKADTIKYRWINDLYNQQFKMTLSDSSLFTATTEELVYQIYFKYTNMLFFQGLLPLFKLELNAVMVNPHHTTLGTTFFSHPLDYRTVYYKLFCQSPEYRSFLFNHISFSYQKIATTYFNEADAGSIKSSRTNDQAPFSPAWDNYYSGLIHLKNIPIRDWYITNVIMKSFEYYSFEESEGVMNDFLTKCRTQKYKDKLISFYASIKHLKAGNKAPGFSLRNEEGKLVSLSDFRGKLVFIDFWGVGCGPCIYDIKNDIPKLHERYHGKDVVFLNICVDVNEARWKRFLSDTKLDGINLYAEGWTENKVCKDYNINAIPHYVLIDKEGRIVDANAPRPYELLSNQNNNMDSLLNQAQPHRSKN